MALSGAINEDTMMKKLLTGLLVALFALPSFASGDLYEFKTKPARNDDGVVYDRDYPEMTINSGTKQTSYGGWVDNKGRLTECSATTMYNDSRMTEGAITSASTRAEPIETEHGRGHVVVTSIGLFHTGLDKHSKIKSVKEVNGRRELKWQHDGMIIRVEPTNEWMQDIQVVWENDGKTTSMIFPSVYLDISAMFDVTACEEDLLR